MSIVQLPTILPSQVGILPQVKRMVSTDTASTITASGYLNNIDLQSNPISSSDILEVLYNYNVNTNQGITGYFFPIISSSGTIQLQRLFSNILWVDVTCSASALASAGKVNVVLGTAQQQFYVRNIIVNYSSAGLSGGGGDRLLKLTDGTTVYNNAGITAALLGTPVNTLWGGSGNHIAGTVAQNTLTVAGSNLYFQYSGGTTDYTTGSVVISVQVQRSA